jgi:hypothetical protein
MMDSNQSPSFAGGGFASAEDDQQRVNAAQLTLQLNRIGGGKIGVNKY